MPWIAMCALDIFQEVIDILNQDVHFPNMTSEHNTRTDSGWTLLFICWLLVSIASLGSLFFSEIMHYAPCSLCWYQRICLFPLVILLARGLFPYDKAVVKFSLPLALAGWLVALYHNLLYIGIVPENLEPCSQGVSCTERYSNLMGVISIPMLSLIAFSIIIILLWILKRRASV